VRRRRGRSPPKGGGQIEPTVARTRAATVAGSARRWISSTSRWQN